MSGSSSSSSYPGSDHTYVNQIIFNIDLDSHESAQTLYVPRRTTYSSLEPGRQFEPERHDVVASIFCVGRDSGIRVVTTSPGHEKSKTGERWLHYVTEAISLKDFKDFALRVTYDMFFECVPVVTDLLDEIAQNYEKQSAYGSYISPGTVVRCDGITRRDLEKQVESATFISFPYFDVGEGKRSAGAMGPFLHRTRDLYQQFYPDESTKRLDDQQKFRGFAGAKASQRLRVPQLWVLILNSTTIISCGPTALPDLAPDYLEFIAENRFAATGPSLVQVTDFFQRVTYLQLSQCRSYLALRKRIEEQCLGKTDVTLDQCLLHERTSNAELEPSRWLSIIDDAKVTLVQIRISRKRPEFMVDQKRNPIQGLKPELLEIEYVELGSYEDPPHHEEVSVVRASNSSAENKVSDYEAELQRDLEAARHRLENQGFQINDPLLFQDGQQTVSPPTKLRALKLPTVVAGDARSTLTVETTSQDLEQPFYKIDFQRVHAWRNELADFQTEKIQEGNEAEVAPVQPKRHQYVESEGSWQSIVPQNNFEFGVETFSAENSLRMPTGDINAAHLAERFGASTFPVRSSPELMNYEENSGDTLSLPTIYPDESVSVRALPQFPRAENLYSSPETNADQSQSSPKSEIQSSDHLEDLTAHGIRETVKRAVAAGLKRNDAEIESEVQKRLGQELQTRLRRFGFQEHQIRGLLYPETTGVPQEQPGVTLIRRELSQKETGIPFKDTRGLRSLNQGEIIKDPEKIFYFNRRNKAPMRPSVSITPQLRIVRKGTWVFENYYSQNLPGTHRPENQYPHGDGKSEQSVATADHDDILSQKRRRDADKIQTEGDSAGNEVKPFDESLRVPPFLAWPTVVKQKTTTGGLESKVFQHSRIELEGPDRINSSLEGLRKRIYVKEKDPEPSEKISRLLIHRAGEYTVTIPIVAISRKAFHEFDLSPVLALDPHDKIGQRGLHKELAFLRPAAHTSPGLDTLEATDSTITPVPDGISQLEKRRFLQWQLARLYTKRDDVVLALKELIVQFVPLECNHALIQRCWGAIQIISQALVDAGEKVERDEQQELENEANILYFIRTIPDKRYIQLHGLQDLDKPVAECEFCRKYRSFADIDDPVEHLQRYHVGDKVEELSGNRKHMGHWLASTLTVNQELSIEYLLDFVEPVHQCIKKLVSKTVDLRSSVAGEDFQEGEKFILPVVLVEACEKTIQFIYFFAYSLQVLQRHSAVPLAPADARELFKERTDVSGAEYLATLADIALSNSRNELSQMAHTGRSRHAVLHFRMPPESTILAVLCSLATRSLINRNSVLEIYQSQLSHLRFETSDKPSKRSLRDLYLIKEELQAIEHVFPQQQSTFIKLSQVLDPNSIRLPSDVRGEAFERFERNQIQRALKYDFPHRDAHLKRIYKTVDKLAETIRYNIDIADEGNSKAILVFTLVTIVFLPLSFVSSLFGMNTADVRDMTSTQTLFWAIALPVTATVGAISLLAAFGGPSFERMLQQLQTDGLSRQPRKPRRLPLDDMERQMSTLNIEKTPKPSNRGSQNGAVAVDAQSSGKARFRSHRQGDVGSRKNIAKIPCRRVTFQVKPTVLYGQHQGMGSKQSSSRFNRKIGKHSFGGTVDDNRNRRTGSVGRMSSDGLENDSLYADPS